jgi:hypothetical protein
MSRVIVELIPLMIGAAVVPVWVIIVLLLLRSEGGLFKAVAFISGQTLVRLAQGFVFGALLRRSAVEQNANAASAIVSTLVLVAGILLSITAVKLLSKEEDPDAPPPRWMAMADSISAVKTFLFSVLWMTVAGKQWLFTLGALGIIREGNLPNAKSTLAFLIFVIGAQSLVLAPILVSTLAPKHSSHLLEISSQWMERNNRRVMIVVSAVFGTYFIHKGITELLG